jgi:hypothetical protein
MWPFNPCPILGTEFYRGALEQCESREDVAPNHIYRNSDCVLGNPALELTTRGHGMSLMAFIESVLTAVKNKS